MKYLLLLGAILFFTSCVEEKQETPAQEIINKTIEVAGGEKYRKATIHFKFREHEYRSIRNGGEFHLERSIVDSTGYVRDVVSNTGFQRFINDTAVAVADSMAIRYGSSVNSVHYFAHLPYGLNDRAVNKKLVGEAEINGEPYYELEITFQQEGGGADHHDEFMYWIHKENYTIDYFAYRFLVNDGGMRFRVAYNPRYIEGIRFVDYKNYLFDNPDVKLQDLDELYEQGKLEMLSDIQKEIVSVQVKE